MAPAENRPATIALALGSNIGNRREVMRAAVTALEPFVKVTAVSPVYETAAAYVTDQPSFLNAVLLGTTILLPMALLWNLKQLETELGRQPTFRYGPRQMDIDILFYENQIIDEPELHIPHPRMQEREFVLKPLADIAPDWKHPKTGATVQEMLNNIPSLQPICLGPL